MTAGDCLFLPYSEYAAITSTSIPLAGYIFLRPRFLQVDQSKNNVPYLAVYKLTFYSLKIGPKNCPQLKLGSKTEIEKRSGQIFCVTIAYLKENSEIKDKFFKKVLTQR